MKVLHRFFQWLKGSKTSKADSQKQWWKFWTRIEAEKEKSAVKEEALTYWSDKFLIKTTKHEKEDEEDIEVQEDTSSRWPTFDWVWKTENSAENFLIESPPNDFLEPISIVFHKSKVKDCSEDVEEPKRRRKKLSLLLRNCFGYE